MQQAADQRAFAVIHTTRGNETQQLRMIERNIFNN
jgi:hypothetical protein